MQQAKLSAELRTDSERNVGNRDVRGGDRRMTMTSVGIFARGGAVSSVDSSRADFGDQRGNGPHDAKHCAFPHAS